ncbi:MAG: ABC transporter substrate-binding protein [Anaerolineae bacterium]
MKKIIIAVELTAAVLVGTACTTDAPADELTSVTLMLDWVPNVNHTGIFVAQENGYFEQEGLQVEIVQPGEVYAEQAVTTGSVEFGISFQEQVSISRADGAPLVSIAAIVHEHTSGFAAPAGLDVESPADFEGLTYGAFGSPFEEPTLSSLMQCAGADFSELAIVNVGFADPLTLLDEGRVDLAWIFFGTQGIIAEQRGIELDIVMMNDYFGCIPNYYTPLFITNDTLIAEQPETVRAFVHAIARGYEFAAANPEEAAQILAAETPETGEAIIRASQQWLSPRYQGDAPQWGHQAEETWEAYTQWMVDNGVIDAPIPVEEAFTNDFLPNE